MAELNPDPQSTWGATEEYKRQWQEQYGDNPPAGNAAKAEWVDFAVEHGADPAEAEASKVADLKDTYTDATVIAGIKPTATGEAKSTAEATGKK